MPRLFAAFAGMLLAAGWAAAPPASALEPPDPRLLGETHFSQLYGFNALEAYETRVGVARAAFTTARRWKNGSAEILIDIRKPESFSKWALLIRPKFDRSDDFFVYIPNIGRSIVRRVRRFSAVQLQTLVIYDLLPLGDLRPVAPGELTYARLPDAEVEGETCIVVEGRAGHRGRGFDRVELAISRQSGFALRTRYFGGRREIRRVLISPDDLRDFGGRLLPARRRIMIPPTWEATELVLRNVLLDAELPDQLFTHHNLRVQRFPSF